MTKEEYKTRRNEQAAKCRARNRDKINERQRLRRAKMSLEEKREEWRRNYNSDATKQRIEKNKERIRQYKREYAKQWRSKLTEEEKYQKYLKVKGYLAAYQIKWRAENKGRATAQVARRRSLLKQCMPKWVDQNAIAEIYKQCHKISKETGIRHHVDHIIPLQGKIVSGLHVPWNLQIIPAVENQRKSNKLVGV